MERGNGNTVLLTVIGVATLLVALVGATFAYFTANISNESAQSVTVGTATPVGLVYTGERLVLENALPGDKLEKKTFTVKNPGGENGSTVAQTYDLTLHVDADNFTKTHTKVTYDENDKNMTGDTEDRVGQLLITISGASDGQGTAVGTVTGTNSPKISAVTTAPAVLTVKDNVATFDLTDGATVQGQKYQFVDNQTIAPGETHTYTMNLNFVQTTKNQNENQGKSATAHVEISDPHSISAQSNTAENN